MIGTTSPKPPVPTTADLLDQLVFKTGNFGRVPPELAKSLLDAGLYEDAPNRSFKKRWSNPEVEMPEGFLYYFSIAFHNDVPVGVAYGQMKINYSVYVVNTGEKFALANGVLGVYVNPSYRGYGLAHGMCRTVLERMAGDRIESSDTRMVLSARRFCRYVVDQPDMAKHFISSDEMMEVLDKLGY
jgi:GNAT superfamily N-acetyltransferase